MGGAALLGGTMLGRFAPAPAAAADDPGYPGLGSSAVHSDGSASLYGHAHEPPSSMAAGDLDRATFPPAESTLEVEIDVVEQTLEVGANVFFPAWTYSGTVPGPILRARAGETIEVRLRNLTSHPHNLHFHGAHSPEMDGWEPIPAGEEFVYRIEAGPPGVHPYHCHVAPLAEHIARGLYGMLIVDPPEGPALRPRGGPAALGLRGRWCPQCGDGVERRCRLLRPLPDQGAGGRAGAGLCGQHDRVRARRVLPPPRPNTFDVYPSGMGERPAFAGDTVTMGQGERAMLEFTLPEVGRYMFHPHQHHLADRGAMGWFAAV
jgi:nitrite reductase (NO-forming)